MLVIVTAGIIGAIVVPFLLSQGAEELQALARERAERLALAQEEYYASHGVFTMERDSLLTVLPDSSYFLDPTTDTEFIIGTANAGQDYSISSTGDFYLLVVTEDRLDKLQEAQLAWHQYQLDLMDQSRPPRP